jgi:hypothetical protein
MTKMSDHVVPVGEAPLSATNAPANKPMMRVTGSV